MTKAERKLLQKREATLFLEKEQYISWFGKDSMLTRGAQSEWMAAFEILELLDIEPDYDLRENIEGMELQRARQEQEEQEIIGEGEGTEQLLKSINTQLKNMQRTDMFGEFSIMRLIAGIIQIIVLFCVLISIWFLISPDRQDNSVFIALGFAMVLQVMSLTFYIMHGRK